ncbi:MAG TPA: hypothetical protein PKH09_14585, partial [Parvularculaceae bacterium]|nr:hypothetical protein [Parvularculaceae bacterium]
SVQAPSAQKKKTAKPARAVVKDPVPCCEEAARTLAPCGEYEIERMETVGAAGRVKLCSCATQNRFTLSFDAFLQHLNEGRIALTR